MDGVFMFVSAWLIVAPGWDIFLVMSHVMPCAKPNPLPLPSAPLNFPLGISTVAWQCFEYDTDPLTGWAQIVMLLLRLLLKKMTITGSGNWIWIYATNVLWWSSIHECSFTVMLLEILVFLVFLVCFCILSYFITIDFLIKNRGSRQANKADAVFVVMTQRGKELCGVFCVLLFRQSVWLDTSVLKCSNNRQKWKKMNTFAPLGHTQWVLHSM